MKLMTKLINSLKFDGPMILDVNCKNFLHIRTENFWMGHSNRGYVSIPKQKRI